MIVWPEPDEVVMVSDEDVPEQAERFALALVLDSEWLTWWELMAKARVEAIEDAELLRWSYEFNSSDV